MIILSGEIEIESAMTLEKLAELLSEKLFSGLTLRPDRSMDETPAMSLSVMGLDVLLHPGDDANRFVLFVDSPGEGTPSEADIRYLKISEYLLERVTAVGLKAKVTALGR